MAKTKNVFLFSWCILLSILFLFNWKLKPNWETMFKMRIENTKRNVETTEDLVLKMTPSLNNTHYNSDVKSHTCAQYTTIDVYSTSDTFHAMITARNCYNETKSFGGDYFRAVIRQNDQNGISCIVEDLHNGSYHVSAPVMFSGLAKFEVQLIHSSESVYAISNKTASFLQPLNDIRVYIEQNNTEVMAFCNIEMDKVGSKRICDYSNKKLNETWVCALPEKANVCGRIIRNHGAKSMAKRQFIEENERALFELNKTFFAPILGSNSSYCFQNNHSIMSNWSCSSTLSDHDNQFNSKTSTGYFRNGHWKTFACKNNEFFINNPRMFEKCLQNKTLYLVGDSTMRQWWEYFEDNLNMSVNKKDENATMPPRYGQVRLGNGRIMFRAHGQPIRALGNYKYHKCVTETLSEITDNKTVIWIVLSIGLHFQLYSPYFYLKRIRKIKEEIVNLISRMPSTKVFIKEISMHISTPQSPSPWLSERMNRIIHHEFYDVTNVYFIKVWDMTSVIISDDVHPSEFIVSQQIALFQSMVCEK